MAASTLDPLGDGVSKVELIWVKGDDLEVVNDARESFEKESDWEYSKGAGCYVLSNADSKLIKYLASHRHWTPFAGSYIKFRIKMPLFVAREWFRHNMIDLGEGDIKPGFNRNEVSRRYVDFTPEFYLPKEWRARPDKGIKQGSGDVIREQALDIHSSYGHAVSNGLESYNFLLDLNVAPEMARMVLSQSMYTEFRESASLYAYAGLCDLRIAPNAQAETRKYAEAVSELIAPYFPVSWPELIQEIRKARE